MEENIRREKKSSRKISLKKSESKEYICMFVVTYVFSWSIQVPPLENLENGKYKQHHDVVQYIGIAVPEENKFGFCFLALKLSNPNICITIWSWGCELCLPSNVILVGGWGSRNIVYCPSYISKPVDRISPYMLRYIISLNNFWSRLDFDDLDLIFKVIRRSGYAKFSRKTPFVLI